MIATSCTADRSPASPVSAHTEIPAGKGGSKDDGAPNLRSVSFLEFFQQSSLRVGVEDSSPSLGDSKKDGKSKKSNSDSAGLDTKAPAVSGENLSSGLPFAPVPAETLAQSTPISAKPPSAVFPTALPVPAFATPEEFRVELNSGRDIGSPAELAFALRLKALASGDDADKPGAPSQSASNGLETKPGEITASALGSLAAVKSADESGADPQSSNKDSNHGDHPATQKMALPDQPEKAAQSGKTETPALVESANVHAQAPELQAMPMTHATTGPPVPAGPAAPRVATQPAPAAPATTTIDNEDRPAARPAQEISLQISSADDRKVDVRLVERAGEVHVTVRTPDVALAHELRQDLGNLTGKLAQSGYGTEQFTPLSAGSSNLSDQRNTPQNQDRPNSNGQGSQQGGSGQQQQSQDERGKRPAWVEEMENSLAQRQTNRSTSWLPTR